jgi:hypothetical protein
MLLYWHVALSLILLTHSSSLEILYIYQQHIRRAIRSLNFATTFVILSQSKFAQSSLLGRPPTCDVSLNMAIQYQGTMFRGHGLF